MGTKEHRLAGAAGLKAFSLWLGAASLAAGLCCRASDGAWPLPRCDAGGTANHVHLLFVLPATSCLATAVQKLKGSSSRWLGQRFSWQEGYGAFS
ncbi:MAG: transposase, partial [Planctomycetota bacterium]